MPSCFNAFSRVDIRVDVKIPGGVNAYVIDLRGERYVQPTRSLCSLAHSIRHEATPEMWQETYVSAILRAIIYSDDPTYWLDAYRKLDPITSPEGELRFLKAAEELFLKGACAVDATSLRWLLTLEHGKAGKSGLTQKSKSRPSFPTTLPLEFSSISETADDSSRLRICSRRSLQRNLKWLLCWPRVTSE